MKAAALATWAVSLAAASATAAPAPGARAVPTTLAMRTALAPEPEPAAPPSSVPIDALPAPRPASLARDAVVPPAPLSERVVFRFNLGFGLDGGRPACDEDTGDCTPNLAGQVPDERADYERLRVYGFGDAVVGSRGLGSSSLSTYLAAQFRFDQGIDEASTAIPSVHDGRNVDDLLVRSAYGHVEELFSHPLLRPLSLRAGRQFRYGVAVSHFDGITLGYDRPGVAVALFTGRQVSLWGLGRQRFDDGAALAGLDLRVDLFELGRLPLVLSANTLQFDGASHAELGVALRWSRDVLLRASVRTLDQELARQTLSLRARVSEVTTVSAELDNRSRGDWLYGLFLLDRVDDPLDPRRYLDLGPITPRTHLDVRAGTVLLDNLDVLLRAAAALERGGEGTQSSHSASYIEGGGAVEVRVRRALRVGSSVTARRYDLDDDERSELDPEAADPLPMTTGAFGMRSFLEGGFHLRATAGARRFNAGAELYGRIYAPHTPYVPDRLETLDTRSGGRFSVEGWAGQRLRLKAEYDVTFSRLDLAPELEGLKTLRVLMEGTF